jgi:hypothetical protein
MSLCRDTATKVESSDTAGGAEKSREGDGIGGVPK